MIKIIIASGCSFTEGPDNNWPSSLDKYLSSVDVHNCGVGSSGNDMIRRRAMYHCELALQKYQPNEICVLPMWSGAERKAFWVDNKEYLKNVYGNKEYNYQVPYYDFLKINEDPNTNIFEFEEHPRNIKDVKSGWHIVNHCQLGISKFCDEYFKLVSTVLGPTIDTIENIVFLEQYCKNKGVHIFHQFYRSYVYDDIVTLKNNTNISYLYDLLDASNIITTQNIVNEDIHQTGNMYEFLNNHARHPSVEESENRARLIINFLKQRELL